METLLGLVRRLAGVVDPVADDPFVDRGVRACSLIDFETAISAGADRTDEVVLLLVDGQERLVEAMRALAESDPALVMVKAVERTGLRALAEQVGVKNVVRVSPALSWGALYVMVDRMIMSGPPPTAHSAGTPATQHSDLFSIATSLAGQVHGYVSIDDAHSRVLAFSPLDEHADQLRRDSILGRGAPAGHREQLRSQGVWEQLRIPGHVVELAGDGEIRPRLAIGIIDDRTELYLGTIWVQEGIDGFAPAAREYLVAAATLAMQTILRADYTETRTAEAQLQLLGLRQSPESSRAVAGIAGVAAATSWTVIGFLLPSRQLGEHASHGALIKLHAVSLGARSTVTVVGPRAYVVVPDPPSHAALRRWAERAVQALSQPSTGVFCATGPIVDSVEALPAARDVVDVLVDRIASAGETGVATYESHQAQLAVSRILQALTERGLLTGRPIAAILATTHVDGEQLLQTLRTYLHGGQHVKSTAEALHIHPNTLRQRLRRVERLTGLSLANSEERLLLDLELRAHIERSFAPSP